MSLLTLAPQRAEEALAALMLWSEAEREEFISLADSNHVLLRALEPVRQMAARNAHDFLTPADATAASAVDPGAVAKGLHGWAGRHIEREKSRVANALRHLHAICQALENSGCAVSVMKSLDHWPDLGNDLDLYSTADERAIAYVMRKHFQAQVEPRSWGDRLAHKWNFAVPGLPEAVEVHAQRLGQTGEHTRMARRFISRRVETNVGGYSFLVPAPEERIVVATLQRMYRHFYFRVCDIVNSAALVESGALDYAELQQAAELGGIWPGVCSYLKIVSDYVAEYRGRKVELPAQILATAPFGGEKLFVRAGFIRVPLMPQGAELYTRQVTATARRGDVPATLRLSLFPYLASAAAISYKLTGSDKGIW
jgi:hypothetical protein